MNSSLIDGTDKGLIARLQGELDTVRRRLGVSDRGAVLFQADLSYADDEMVLVEADGLGGATLRVVEGNYPIDSHEERAFSTEAEAVTAAEALCVGVSA